MSIKTISQNSIVRGEMTEHDLDSLAEKLVEQMKKQLPCACNPENCQKICGITPAEHREHHRNFRNFLGTANLAKHRFWIIFFNICFIAILLWVGKSFLSTITEFIKRILTN